jgi:YbbR domain-containing protein
MIAGIKRWFGHNPFLKIMALIIGIVVWIIASRWVYEPSTLVVPVELKLAEGMTVTGITPDKVTVTLEYPRESHDLIEEGKSEIKFIHDLTGNRTPGRINFELQPDDLTRPARFRVVSVSPSRITAEIDRLVEKVLPVKVVYWGSPRPGYRLAGQRVIPPEVRVPGPETILDEMTEIETEPVNIMGREITFDTSAVLSPLSRFSPGKEQRVTVIVILRPELQQRSFEGVGVDFLKDLAASDDVQVIPREVNLYLKGPTSVMEALTIEDLRVYIDIVGLKPGTWELPLRTAFPAGVILDRADPDIIKVTIEPGPASLLGPGTVIQ